MCFERYICRRKRLAGTSHLMMKTNISPRSSAKGKAFSIPCLASLFFRRWIKDKETGLITYIKLIWISYTICAVSMKRVS